MLMGMDRLAVITREMLAHGSRKDLPVALVHRGTVGQQKTIVGTLENITERANAAGFEAPAVAIFGDVVSLRKDLNRSEEHTSELQSLTNLVCRLLLEKKKSCAGAFADATLFSSCEGRSVLSRRS